MEGRLHIDLVLLSRTGVMCVWFSKDSIAITGPF